MSKVFHYSCLFLILFALGLQAQTRRALFLGNSYTAANSLPQMVANMANSTGDTLLFDSNTPGGFRFQAHVSNALSLAKIAAGNWHYVVLQEQSQLPSFPEAQVQTEVYPFARALDSLTQWHNPCAETVFYMTWGRKNGDANNCPIWPPVCTYSGMDSLLSLRYQTMANQNQAIVSPVGAVWKYLRTHAPQIELYEADESHPSVAGTYAAAVGFYTCFFRQNPELIAFNATLPPNTAQTIRQAAKTVVYDSLINWNVGLYDPMADFTITPLSNYQFQFNNQSTQASQYEWDFGDGQSSVDPQPIHTYSIAGTYNVTLKATHCHQNSSKMQTLSTGQMGVNLQPMKQAWVYPNPAHQMLVVSPAPHQIGQKYSLYNAQGQIVKQGVIQNPQMEIPLQTLPFGLYTLYIDGPKPQYQSIIKQP